MIGFIGLGKMGIPMAGNLLTAGMQIAIYARSYDKLTGLIDAGAKCYDSPAQMLIDCDSIFTILGGPADVEALYLGKDGLIAGAKPGSIFVDMTTSSPKLATQLTRAGLKASVSILDAPVTGGVPGAEKARLCFMVGGDAAAFARIEPILEIMGSKIIHMGPAGTGQAAKACNQLAVSGIMLGMSEALNLALAENIDTEKVFEILNTGTAASTLMQRLGRKMLDGDNAASFTVAHFIKDLKIASQYASQHGVPVHSADYCRSLCETIDPDSGLQALLNAAKPKENPDQK